MLPVNPELPIFGELRFSKTVLANILSIFGERITKPPPNRSDEVILIGLICEPLKTNADLEYIEAPFKRLFFWSGLH